MRNWRISARLPRHVQKASPGRRSANRTPRENSPASGSAGEAANAHPGVAGASAASPAGPASQIPVDRSTPHTRSDPDRLRNSGDQSCPLRGRAPGVAHVRAPLLAAGRLRTSTGLPLFQWEEGVLCGQPVLDGSAMQRRTDMQGAAHFGTGAASACLRPRRPTPRGRPLPCTDDE